MNTKNDFGENSKEFRKWTSSVCPQPDYCYFALEEKNWIYDLKCGIYMFAYEGVFKNGEFSKNKRFFSWQQLLESIIPPLLFFF